MDESFSAVGGVGGGGGAKFPPGEPSDGWTIEELIRWSLDRHHARASERTAAGVEALRDQCERECEDVMTLHEAAVELAKKNEEGASAAAGNNKGGAAAVADEENLNPQSTENPAEDGVDSKPSAAPAGPSQPPSSASTTIEVQMTVGPHAPSKFLLRPRPGAPCLIGRSKGKKFVKNGVSLHKDQEVSTTHGKFVVEYFGGGGEGGEAPAATKFYFVDVGSTNGTVHGERQLEPNAPLPLEDGTELKVGNSVLRIILG